MISSSLNLHWKKSKQISKQTSKHVETRRDFTLFLYSSIIMKKIREINLSWFITSIKDLDLDTDTSLLHNYILTIKCSNYRVSHQYSLSKLSLQCLAQGIFKKLVHLKRYAHGLDVSVKNEGVKSLALQYLLSCFY